MRRSSNDPLDFFHAHIGGMDAFARGLLIAKRMTDDKVFSKFMQERSSSYASGIGAAIMTGQVGMEEVEKWIMNQKYPVVQSGRQEMLGDILNSYLE